MLSLVFKSHQKTGCEKPGTVLPYMPALVFSTSVAAGRRAFVTVKYYLRDPLLVKIIQASCPSISASEHPRSRSAPALQLVTWPSRSVVKIA